MSKHAVESSNPEINVGKEPPLVYIPAMVVGQVDSSNEGQNCEPDDKQTNREGNQLCVNREDSTVITMATNQSVLKKSIESDTDDPGANHTLTLDEFVRSYLSRRLPGSCCATMKEMRCYVPRLVMYCYGYDGSGFGSKSVFLKKKVKGLWTEKPLDWPDGVPFCDPCNSRGSHGKPNKQMLTPMFDHLIKLYQEKKGMTTSNCHEEQQNKAVVDSNLNITFQGDCSKVPDDVPRNPNPTPSSKVLSTSQTESLSSVSSQGAKQNLTSPVAYRLLLSNSAEHGSRPILVALPQSPYTNVQSAIQKNRVLTISSHSKPALTPESSQSMSVSCPSSPISAVAHDSATCSPLSSASVSRRCVSRPVSPHFQFQNVVRPASRPQTVSVPFDRKMWRNAELDVCMQKYLDPENKGDVWPHVKEMRPLISQLVAYCFGFQDHANRTKVKGMWAEKPTGWPENVPYLDPSNSRDGESKPRKDILLTMFSFLREVYKVQMKYIKGEILDADEVAPLEDVTKSMDIDTENPRNSEYVYTCIKFENFMGNSAKPGRPACQYKSSRPTLPPKAMPVTSQMTPAVLPGSSIHSNALSVVDLTHIKTEPTCVNTLCATGEVTVSSTNLAATLTPTTAPVSSCSKPTISLPPPPLLTSAILTSPQLAPNSCPPALKPCPRLSVLPRTSNQVKVCHITSTSSTNPGAKSPIVLMSNTSHISPLPSPQLFVASSSSHDISSSSSSLVTHASAGPTISHQNLKLLSNSQSESAQPVSVKSKSSSPPQSGSQLLPQASTASPVPLLVLPPHQLSALSSFKPTAQHPSATHSIAKTSKISSFRTIGTVRHIGSYAEEFTKPGVAIMRRIKNKISYIRQQKLLNESEVILLLRIKDFLDKVLSKSKAVLIYFLPKAHSFEYTLDIVACLNAVPEDCRLKWNKIKEFIDAVLHGPSKFPKSATSEDGSSTALDLRTNVDQDDETNVICIEPIDEYSSGDAHNTYGSSLNIQEGRNMNDKKSVSGDTENPSPGCAIHSTARMDEVQDIEISTGAVRGSASLNIIDCTDRDDKVADRDISPGVVKASSISNISTYDGISENSSNDSTSDLIIVEEDSSGLDVLDCIGQSIGKQRGTDEINMNVCNVADRKGPIVVHPGVDIAGSRVTSEIQQVGNTNLSNTSSSNEVNIRKESLSNKDTCFNVNPSRKRPHQAQFHFDGGLDLSVNSDKHDAVQQDCNTQGKITRIEILQTGNGDGSRTSLCKSDNKSLSLSLTEIQLLMECEKEFERSACVGPQFRCVKCPALFVCVASLKEHLQNCVLPQETTTETAINLSFRKRTVLHVPEIKKMSSGCLSQGDNAGQVHFDASMSQCPAAVGSATNLKAPDVGHVTPSIINVKPVDVEEAEYSIDDNSKFQGKSDLPVSETSTNSKEHPPDKTGHEEIRQKYTCDIPVCMASSKNTCISQLPASDIENVLGESSHPAKKAKLSETESIVHKPVGINQPSNKSDLQPSKPPNESDLQPSELPNKADLQTSEHPNKSNLQHSEKVSLIPPNKKAKLEDKDKVDNSVGAEIVCYHCGKGFKDLSKAREHVNLCIAGVPQE